ncbi:MAG: 23S rRNA (adenine(2503)-C(2))-methyltransferase RlmN, partial [Armatimonadota bacterium]|nr:23S rRNA (adenine(2503)-C(2))-methyltransferase RlmN [Armatimonadota bacterium]
LGEPRFRGRQIAKWLYKHNAVSFDEMTDLPLSLRQRLKEDFVLYRAQVVNRSTSRDGTTKLLLKLEDNQTIESVIIPYE